MRIDKINELIKQELGKVLLESVEFEDAFVTITNVDTAPNLDSSKVWISIFPEDREVEIVNTLKDSVGKIQKVLNKRLVLRFVPRILFRVDRSEKYAEDIGEVFDKNV